MIIAGVDIGSRHTKVVLVDRQGNILAMYSSRTRPPLIELVDANIESALGRIGAERGDVGYVATTGFGRSSYPERDLQLTDVTSAAFGAMHTFPNTKCVIDIGAQSSRAMKLSPDGRVREFKSNDKCAAGAGGFVERAAHYLEIPLEDVGRLSMNGDAPVTISSVCAVLAESEIINHVSRGESAENILRGVHDSLSERATLLLKRVGIELEVTLVGGMGNQEGMLRSLSETLAMPMNRPENPEMMNALGAALLGIRKLERSAA